MKLVSAISVALGLAACAGGDIRPTRLTDSASAGMWTDQPADEVAACIAAATQGTVSGSSVETPAGVRYDVVTLPAVETYRTAVAQIGTAPAAEAPGAVTLCLLSAATRAEWQRSSAM